MFFLLLAHRVFYVFVRAMIGVCVRVCVCCLLTLLLMIGWVKKGDGKQIEERIDIINAGAE